jgi:hypothetical protein
MRAPRADEEPLRADAYPFGRAEGSFFLNGGDVELPGGPPLLAYGANASPERLAAKLGPRARVAALAGVLRGWAIVHSNHVSPYGAVPATLVPAAGASAAVHVLLLGDPAPLDVTEPNYHRRRLTGLDLEVERLGRLDAVDAYVSKWGPLEVGGQPVPLGSMPQDTLLRAVRA